MSTRRSDASALRLGAEEGSGGALVGRVTSFERGEAGVELPGTTGTVMARVATSIDDAALERAARERQEAVLLLEDGDPARPILLALLRSRTPLVDAVLAGPMPEDRREARLDGKRVVLEGKEEVVLRCGKASLTLTKDGKAVLRGVNLVTQADQVHKIRGGKVQVN